VLLVRSRRGSGERAWGDDLLAFEAGYGAFAGWMVVSERWTRTNTAPG
jgi:hypothetical protein